MKKAYSQRQEFIENQLNDKINGLQEKLKKKNNELTDLTISKQEMEDEIKLLKTKLNDNSQNL